MNVFGQWKFDGCNYDDGVLLYEKYGSNQVYKKLFKIRNSFSEQLLYDELKKIPDIPDKPVHPKKEKKSSGFAKHSKSVHPAINPATLPPELQIKNIRKGQLFKEAAFCFDRLDLLGTDEERFESAKIILSNYDEINNIWEEIDYFLKHGRTMEEDFERRNKIRPRPVLSSDADMLRRLHNLRSNISKNRNNPQKKLKVDAWMKERDELEGKFK